MQDLYPHPGNQIDETITTVPEKKEEQKIDRTMSAVKPLVELNLQCDSGEIVDIKLLPNPDFKPE